MFVSEVIWCARCIGSPEVFSSGIDSALLSKAMGHTTIATLMKYYFPDIEEEDKPLEKKVINKPNKSKVIKLSEYDPIRSFLSDVVSQS